MQVHRATKSRELERKQVGLLEIKLAEDAGAFSGYGAVFGNVDSQGDVIAPGAFAASLAEWKDRGKFPPMLLQHGGGFMGGADDLLPIGQWTSMEEDRRGLKVDGQLFAIGTERGQYLRAGLTSGVLDGLSIGFMVREARYGTEDGEPDRTLTDIDLWEVSVVTFPANPKARVLDAKTLSNEQVRELETRFREGGLSRREAQVSVSVLKSWLQRDAGVPASAPRDAVVPEAGLDADVEALQRLLAMIKA